ncbi:DMT family transporter [Pantoea coffeiphila]|uniref:EamA domain-containing protein n=1 Tax=Pantoea coffeiphila TaxID=1465635 RepID=A0A2S9I784_9GAMM|nr:DMT family transporter [Pantoea coffeiphila]PRD13650.1 hypothetical protein CQW29_20635 [Pantoea coffeiphila]
MNEKKHAAVGVQVCTMLFGLSAVIAKDLSLPASTIVAGRALWAAISLGLLVILFRRNDWNRLSLRETGHLLINGALLAGHWLCFFYGIVEGGVAVGTLGFASFPVFVSLLEKTFFNKPITPLKVWCTALIAAGLLIISPDIFDSSQLGSGLAWSLAAGFSYALIVLYNRHTASNASSIQASFIQFISCATVTFPWGYSSLISIDYTNFLGLMLLGVICTAVAYTFLIFAIKKVEAGKAAIIISLEPVWAIFFAAIWLHEVPTIQTFIGGSMVISAVIISSRESLSDQSGQRS